MLKKTQKRGMNYELAYVFDVFLKCELGVFRLQQPHYQILKKLLI